MKKKILTLTVSKQWFDKIVACEKTEEYREIKPYWIKRLTTNCEVAYDVAAETYCGEVLYRPYTHVLFINGYRKDSPRIEKEIVSITIGKPKKGLCPDKWLDKEFFVIKFEQRMKQKKVELCVPGSLIWSQIDDYLDTDLIGGGKRARHSGRAIREILESDMMN